MTAKTMKPKTRPNKIGEHHFGWRPDLPDPRDHVLEVEMETLRNLPETVRHDLDPAMPSVYNQLQLGSCTGNGVAACIEFDLRQKNLADFMPSRLFVYFNERVIEGTADTDSGAQIRDGVKTVVKQGVCTETTWPYDIGKFADEPPAAAYSEALATKAHSYARVPQTQERWQAALANGHLIVFGFTVFASFETIKSDGIMPMPRQGESVLGGHCVVAVGYAVIDGELYLRVRNSWGTGWGDGGYFWMPFNYAMDANTASDAWMIRTVT